MLVLIMHCLAIVGGGGNTTCSTTRGISKIITMKLVLLLRSPLLLSPLFWVRPMKIKLRKIIIYKIMNRMRKYRAKI